MNQKPIEKNTNSFEFVFFVYSFARLLNLNLVRLLLLDLVKGDGQHAVL